MQTIKAKLIGRRPLLMHADTLSNPLHPKTKEHKKITTKKKKTEDDHELIAKSQWLCGLYIDENGPFLPGVNVEACLIAGGKLSKLGAQLKRSVEILDDKCHLEYDGPKSAEALWDAGFVDARSVKISQSRVMSFRPLFRKWSCNVEILFDPESIDRDQVIKCLEDGGAYCGIGDYRPKFGRFDVQVLS